MNPNKYIIPADVITDKDYNHIAICEMSVTYMQNPDTNSSQDDYQTLTIEAASGACMSTTERLENPDKEAFYFNIKTNKWSVEKPEEVAFLIEDFRKRLNFVNFKKI